MPRLEILAAEVLHVRVQSGDVLGRQPGEARHNGTRLYHTRVKVVVAYPERRTHAADLPQRGAGALRSQEVRPRKVEVPRLTRDAHRPVTGPHELRMAVHAPVLPIEGATTHLLGTSFMCPGTRRSSAEHRTHPDDHERRQSEKCEPCHKQHRQRQALLRALLDLCVGAHGDTLSTLRKGASV